MNEIKRLKLLVKSLKDSVNNDKKFFGPVITFANEFTIELEDENLNINTQKSLIHYATLIDNFFAEYRRRPEHAIFIAPEQITKCDPIVNEILSLSTKLSKIYTQDFINLLPCLPKNLNNDKHSVDEIINLLNKFHGVTLNIKQRHENRPTLEIKDEYDVQDLLNSLLSIFVDDIRPEEYTPSYAGTSSRVDFFLPQLELVVETKMV